MSIPCSRYCEHPSECLLHDCETEGAHRPEASGFGPLTSSPITHDEAAAMGSGGLLLLCVAACLWSGGGMLFWWQLIRSLRCTHNTAYTLPRTLLATVADCRIPSYTACNCCCAHCLQLLSESLSCLYSPGKVRTTRKDQGLRPMSACNTHHLVSPLNTWQFVPYFTTLLYYFTLLYFTTRL